MSRLSDRTLCLLVKGAPPVQVLLGFKKTGFGAGKYSGIGGKVEPGESITVAALRELDEETGVKAAEHDLQLVGQLTFLFPNRPAWSQVVHVFLAARWEGEPIESDEMRPAWFSVDQLPFGQMWQDAHHWLPGILKGEFTRMRFVFEDDNETVREVEQEVVSDGN